MASSMGGNAAPNLRTLPFDGLELPIRRRAGKRALRLGSLTASEETSRHVASLVSYGEQAGAIKEFADHSRMLALIGHSREY